MSRSIQEWQHGLRKVLQGPRQELGVVLLIFLLSRLAFYMAALIGVWLLPEAVAEPSRVDVNSPVALAIH